MAGRRSYVRGESKGKASAATGIVLKVEEKNEEFDEAFLILIR